MPSWQLAAALQLPWEAHCEQQMPRSIWVESMPAESKGAAEISVGNSCCKLLVRWAAAL
jgi:hypothetical protein